jgi:ammonium transporter, Amt family
MANPDTVGLDTGAVSWTLVSTALVLLMTPALAFFYGGLVHSTAVVHTMMLSFSSLAVIGLTWSFFGYSLAFGPPASPHFNLLGNLSFGFFDSPSVVRTGTEIPEHAFFEFQGAFATITTAVVSGAVAGRIRLWSWVCFAVLWWVLCTLGHVLKLL